jgi:hypothetical protein
MRNGIYIPAFVVRIAVGTIAIAAVAAIAFNASDAVRYIKMETM